MEYGKLFTREKYIQQGSQKSDAILNIAWIFMEYCKLFTGEKYMQLAKPLFGRKKTLYHKFGNLLRN